MKSNDFDEVVEVVRKKVTHLETELEKHEFLDELHKDMNDYLGNEDVGSLPFHHPFWAARAAYQTALSLIGSHVPVVANEVVTEVKETKELTETEKALALANSMKQE